VKFPLTVESHIVATFHRSLVVINELQYGFCWLFKISELEMYVSGYEDHCMSVDGLQIQFYITLRTCYKIRLCLYTFSRINYAIIMRRLFVLTHKTLFFVSESGKFNRKTF